MVWQVSQQYHRDKMLTISKGVSFICYQGLFSGAAGVAWMWQFLRHLSKNVLTEEEQNDGWTSNGKAYLGYSFYFVIVAGLFHLINMALIYAATRSPRRNKRAAVDKHPEGLIMLY